MCGHFACFRKNHGDVKARVDLQAGSYLTASDVARFALLRAFVVRLLRSCVFPILQQVNFYTGNAKLDLAITPARVVWRQFARIVFLPYRYTYV